METAYIVCDQCGNKTQTLPVRYGGHSRYNWVYVTKSMSNSESSLTAGQLTFCGDKCLALYVKEKIKK